LKYDNSVMLSILDNRIEARPACDKIIRNSSDVDYPYFRADSFIGSLYIQDTGLFNIQIISEKIVTKEIRKAESLGSDNSKLLSVFSDTDYPVILTARKEFLKLLALRYIVDFGVQKI